MPTNPSIHDMEALVARGTAIDSAMALSLVDADTDLLANAAARLRDLGHGPIVTVSRKVFIPLTKLCRDVCGYCTFAHPPRQGQRAYMSAEEVLQIARAGAAAGCDEALFTLGDKPEARYRVAREELAALGHETTLDYLEDMAGLVLRETGLLPHINAGVMGVDEMTRLKAVSVSQGLMLETISDRLSARGGPHFGSPDKRPAVRLATLDAAGRAGVPFTTGLLIGIGETRAERIEALVAIRALHARYGHIQEIIVQNFRAKPGTRMAAAPEPSLTEQVWTIAAARMIFGPEMAIQSPPNLRRGDLPALISAGINDWGGVSPVTPDHVNPEAPWPELQALARATAMSGKTLAPRLAVYPSHQTARWLTPKMRAATLRRSDASGLAQEGPWRVGRTDTPTPDGGWLSAPLHAPALHASLTSLLDGIAGGRPASEEDIVRLFAARGDDARAVMAVADALRREQAGDTVAYVVNRNINYTNVCGYKCSFCAFSKGSTAEGLRGKPYDLDLEEIARRATEAWSRGATEVCLQGGIHPDYTGETYLAILRAIQQAVPEMHIHAFSPLEVSQGAATLGLPLRTYLAELKAAGLSTLPGTAAEILDDEVRAVICPDKLDTAGWLEVVETAHDVGLRTTATIMFGHVEGYNHWARHLLRLRALQQRTGGLTEIVPLPFVHMEAPMYRKGQARQGPSWREAVLMHAVTRLVLGALVRNIQVSWVKMGDAGVAAALAAGANDLGGTLMNESISRAAGTAHGQEAAPDRMEAMIRAAARAPRQRTTLYGAPPELQIARSRQAAPLSQVSDPPAGKFARIAGRSLGKAG